MYAVLCSKGVAVIKRGEKNRERRRRHRENEEGEETSRKKREKERERESKKHIEREKKKFALSQEWGKSVTSHATNSGGVRFVSFTPRRLEKRVKVHSRWRLFLKRRRGERERERESERKVCITRAYFARKHEADAA